MMVYCVIIYIVAGLFTFFVFNDIFDDEKFYEIFKKLWIRILFRLTFIFLWPLWVSLAVFIVLVFLFGKFIDALTK